MAFYSRGRRPLAEEEKSTDAAKARTRAMELLAGQELSSGQLYERLNRLTRADATTQNRRKAMVFSSAMDEMEQRVRDLKEKEDFDAIRPDIDGNEIMTILGIAPGPEVGRAYKHMLEYRLDNGPVDHDTAVAELKRWHASL